MKLITVEEHYFHLPPGVTPPPANVSLVQGTLPDSPLFENVERMYTMGDLRLTDMDADGVSMQVVSMPMAQVVEPGQAAAVVRGTNEVIASKVAEHLLKLQA